MTKTLGTVAPLLALLALSITALPGATIFAAGPVTAATGTGLPTSVWSFSTFHGTIAAFDAARGSSAPTSTFLTNTVYYPLSTGLGVQDFVGSSGSNFSAGTPATMALTYFLLTGYIQLDTSGPASIPFRLLSDDGSQLFLGGIQIINNDGVHTSAAVTGTVEITQSGLYPIVVKYFNNNSQGVLRLTYDPTNSGTFIDIPTSKLFAEVTPEPSTAWLGGGALLALAFLSRRQNRTMLKP
ncbi:MAG: PA14 domain-containing protein [Bryobacteraceae bacterium]